MSKLLALHNITETKLKGVLELGAFPMPSLAITMAEFRHHIIIIISKKIMPIWGMKIFNRRFDLVAVNVSFFNSRYRVIDWYKFHKVYPDPMGSCIIK